MTLNHPDSLQTTISSCSVCLCLHDHSSQIKALLSHVRLAILEELPPGTCSYTNTGTKVTQNQPHSLPIQQKPAIYGDEVGLKWSIYANLLPVGLLDIWSSLIRGHQTGKVKTRILE